MKRRYFLLKELNDTLNEVHLNSVLIHFFNSYRVLFFSIKMCTQTVRYVLENFYAPVDCPKLSDVSLDHFLATRLRYLFEYRSFDH